LPNPSTGSGQEKLNQKKGHFFIDIFKYFVKVFKISTIFTKFFPRLQKFLTQNSTYVCEKGFLPKADRLKECSKLFFNFIGH
jgi:hypothetical protein